MHEKKKYFKLKQEGGKRMRNVKNMIKEHISGFSPKSSLQINLLFIFLPDFRFFNSKSFRIRTLALTFFFQFRKKAIFQKFYSQMSF